MGYSHYWVGPFEIAPGVFRSISHDFSLVVSCLEKYGIPLAGWDGRGFPEITNEVIAFNGVERCGHEPHDQISIPWPSTSACGIKPANVSVAGTWNAGVLLSARTCNGCCTYETMRFDRVVEPSERTEDKHKRFACCKTGFRPYDVAVIALLIIAKHYLGDELDVTTDGEDANWLDGKLICAMALDYGLDYVVCEHKLISL